MANAISHMVLTFILALILCITFESPIHGIEKILLKRFGKFILEWFKFHSLLVSIFIHGEIRMYVISGQKFDEHEYWFCIWCPIFQWHQMAAITTVITLFPITNEVIRTQY